MGLTRDVSALRGLAEPGIDPTTAPLWETSRQPRFPGALLPARETTGGSETGGPASVLVIYAVAETPIEWRKLQPLLLAYAGPTLSDFEGAPAVMDPAHPVEAAILQLGVYAAARLRPGRFDRAELALTRALQRLQTAVLSAPDLSASRPEPTSRLLARLQDALNGTDLVAAREVLDTLRRELRLDAANLAQLEMQILAVGGHWTEIRWHERFEALAASSPSPATAKVLLEAIWLTQLADHSERDEAEVRRVWRDVADFVEPLLRVVGETADPVLDGLRALSGAATGEPGPRAASEQEVPRDSGAAPAPPFQRAASAFHGLLTAPECGDPAADQEALAALEGFSEEDRARFLAPPRLRALWTELQSRTQGKGQPRSWTDWLARLEDDAFDASGGARRGVMAWELGDRDIDPAEALELADALLAVPDGLASERLSEGLPFLTQWATADLRWPRSVLGPVYQAAVLRLAVASRKGEAAMKSANALTVGALRVGVAPHEYRDLLDCVWEIVTAGLGQRSAYDALELIDTVCSIAPPDSAAQQSFVSRALAAFQSLRDRLTAGQRVMVRELGTRFGWSEPEGKCCRAGYLMGSQSVSLMAIAQMAEPMQRRDG